MDAVRLSDNRTVFLKRIAKNSEELRIIRHFSSAKLRSDPKNHAIPLLEVISDDESQSDILVLPLLRRYNNPPFEFVDEVIEFVRQTLEVRSLLALCYLPISYLILGLGFLS